MNIYEAEYGVRKSIRDLQKIRKMPIGLQGLQGLPLGFSHSAPTPPPIPYSCEVRKPLKGTRKEYIMNKFKYGIAAALMIVATVGTVRADGASATGTASATVTSALTLTTGTPINFGSFMTNGTAGQIVLSAAGVRTLTGGGTLGSATAVTVGSFSLTGTPNAVFVMNPPSVPFNITDSASHTMQVSSFQSTDGCDGTPTPLSGVGAATIHCGAYLVYGTATQNPAGAYSGTYTISAIYQ